MANPGAGEIIVLDLPSFVANSDLSAKQGYCATIVSAGTVDVVSVANDEDILGILDSEAKAGQSVAVRVLGVIKAIVGASVTVGAPLTSDSNGRLVTATSSQRAIARALEGITLPATPTGSEAISVLLTGPFSVAGS